MPVTTGFSEPRCRYQLILRGECWPLTAWLFGDAAVESGGGCTTQSIVMRSKSGTVRMIEAYHRLAKLNEYSAVDFTGDKSAAYPLP